MDAMSGIILLTKYLIQGLAVAVVSLAVIKKQYDHTAIITMAITAAIAAAILDTFAPRVASGYYTGLGFGLGAQQVGFPGVAGAGAAVKARAEGFSNLDGTDSEVDMNLIGGAHDAMYGVNQYNQMNGVAEAAYDGEFGWAPAEVDPVGPSDVGVMAADVAAGIAK